MSSFTRREFNRAVGLATGAALASPAMNVLGANDDVRMAIIGIRGKGKQHIGKFNSLKGVRIVALCDADRKILEDRAEKLEKKNTGQKVDRYVDFRKLLERDDIDAVAIATPNHLHSLIAITACQAGKDVYVEKPLSHTVWEGRKLVEAAQKYDRIVQHGTQNRSDRGLRDMYPWLLEGNLGKIKSIMGLCYRGRTGIGKRDTPLTAPDSVDYNLWLGPAAELPMYRPQFHYDWHWIWNTGNGDIGNQGPHEMDLLRWALPGCSLPKNVLSFGGRFGWHDAGETPNMQFAIFDFGDIPAFFEVRDLRLKPDVKQKPHYKGTRVGVIIECEGGSFKGGRGGGWIYDKNGERMKQFKGDGGGGHQQNFIDAVRSRKESDLHAPVENGHLSASLSHLANISFQVGKEATPGELNEQMKGNAVAEDAIERFDEQLANWNMDFKKEPWTMGHSLAFNPDRERFTGEGPTVKKANSLLRRNDRKPFVVPEKV